LLPAEAPEDAASGPGFTPLVPAPRLAAAVGVGEVLLKLDLTNPTHSFKDRVVAVAAAKAREFGLDTLSCTSTGNLANAVAARAAAVGMPAVIFCPAGLEPEKITATTVYGARVYGVRGSYDDCSRLVSELAGEVEWGFVNVNLRSYYAEGSKTLAFEIAEQLGWQFPDAVIAPIASGAMFSKVHQGFGELLELGLVEGTRPRVIGGQAEGCAPVAQAFADGARVRPVRPNTIARSIAIGSPADGDVALAAAVDSGGAVYAVAEEEIAENVQLLAETTGVFGETAPGATVGALREAVRRGRLGESDRVVLLVTGDGLKTPNLVADRLDPLSVDPDAELVIERLGVAA
jgi:threonine synthase